MHVQIDVRNAYHDINWETQPQCESEFKPKTRKSTNLIIDPQYKSSKTKTANEKMRSENTPAKNPSNAEHPGMFNPKHPNHPTIYVA